jgi:hypothetical protein
MGNTRENRFTVHQRLAASEARLTALEAENKTLRQWVASTVASQINDAANTIKSAQESDFRDLQDTFGGKFSDLQASIRIPRDGVDGAVGPVGPRGECTIPNTDEVARELIAIRLKLAKFQAAVLHSYQLTWGTKHSGLRSAILSTLKTLELQSGIFVDQKDLDAIRKTAGL